MVDISSIWKLAHDELPSQHVAVVSTHSFFDIYIVISGSVNVRSRPVIRGSSQAVCLVTDLGKDFSSRIERSLICHYINYITKPRLLLIEAIDQLKKGTLLSL